MRSVAVFTGVVTLISMSVAPALFAEENQGAPATAAVISPDPDATPGADRVATGLELIGSYLGAKLLPASAAVKWQDFAKPYSNVGNRPAVVSPAVSPARAGNPSGASLSAFAKLGGVRPQNQPAGALPGPGDTRDSLLESRRDPNRSQGVISVGIEVRF